jgi:hypothetical protein
LVPEHRMPWGILWGVLQGGVVSPPTTCLDLATVLQAGGKNASGSMSVLAVVLEAVVSLLPKCCQLYAVNCACVQWILW